MNALVDGDKKVGSFKYTARELQSYQVIYNQQTVSDYTFQHAFEGENEIKWSIATSSALFSFFCKRRNCGSK